LGGTRLLELLAGLESHPYLRGRLALKGGTALNVFVFDLPRLSVDIDLNYVGAADRRVPGPREGRSPGA
jgi:predicted nucleotidyltransferase component of viral defense system